MDLIEEILDLGRTLSTKKLKELVDSIASRVPHGFLPQPGCMCSTVHGACVRRPTII